MVMLWMIGIVVSGANEIVLRQFRIRGKGTLRRSSHGSCGRWKCKAFTENNTHPTKRGQGSPLSADARKQGKHLGSHLKP